MKIARGLSGAVAENSGYVTLPALKSKHIHIITSGVVNESPQSMVTSAWPMPLCNQDDFLRVSLRLMVLTFKFTARGVDASEKIDESSQELNCR
jgi:hypothetical protein